MSIRSAPQRRGPGRVVAKVGRIGIGLFVSAAAWVVLPAQAKAAEPAAAPASRPLSDKKLIEFGWDEPDTAFMRQHVAEMEATPFDGCVFHANYLKGEGEQAKNAGGFTWECWGKRAFTAAE